MYTFRNNDAGGRILVVVSAAAAATTAAAAAMACCRIKRINQCICAYDVVAVPRGAYVVRDERREGSPQHVVCVLCHSALMMIVRTRANGLTAHWRGDVVVCMCLRVLCTLCGAKHTQWRLGPEDTMPVRSIARET